MVTATKSPACAEGTAFRSFPWISRRSPIRSVLPVRAWKKEVLLWREPDHTRRKATLPTCGSTWIFQTCAVKGPVGDTTAGCPSGPFAGRTTPSAGLGVSWQTKSRNWRIPSSFAELVWSTGTMCPVRIAFGKAWNSSSFVTAPSLKYFSMSASSHSTTASITCLRSASACGFTASGRSSANTLKMRVTPGPNVSGKLSGITCSPKFARSDSMSASGSMFSASMRVRTTRRTNSAFPASWKRRRAVTPTPSWAFTQIATVSTAAVAATASPTKSWAPGASINWTRLPCHGRWTVAARRDCLRSRSSGS